MSEPVRDLKLDADGDLDTSGGTLHLVSGADAAKQGAEIRIQFFQGEWFLDLDEGIPYFSRVLIKNPSFPEVREWFRLAILATPDVQEVRSVNITYLVDRRIRVNWRARMLTGEEVSS